MKKGGGQGEKRTEESQSKAKQLTERWVHVRIISPATDVKRFDLVTTSFPQGMAMKLTKKALQCKLLGRGQRIMSTWITVINKQSCAV